MNIDLSTNGNAGDVIKRIYDSYDQDMTARPRIGVGSINKCARALQAKVREIPADKPFPGNVLSIFEMGHYVEELAVKRLRAAGYQVKEFDNAIGKQIKVKAYNGGLLGFVDGIIWLDGMPWVLEIKSSKQRVEKYSKKTGKRLKPPTTDKSFDKLLEAGSYEAWNPDYGAAVHVYAYLMREGMPNIKGALAVVKCKNDGRWYAERIPLDEVKAKALVDKAGDILRATETIPKPEEAVTKYCKHCSWCDRKGWCWSPTAEVTFDE